MYIRIVHIFTKKTASTPINKNSYQVLVYFLRNLINENTLDNNWMNV